MKENRNEECIDGRQREKTERRDHTKLVLGRRSMPLSMRVMDYIFGELDSECLFIGA